MSRMARKKILYDGCFAHILSRSFEDRWIFKGDGEMEVFKQLLLEAKKEYGFRVHHYCLMNTHFHMAVSMPEVKGFTKGMQGVKWEYTKYYNERHRRNGPLWRERFKSLLIEDEGYLYACGLYIEHNPVKAKMVGKAEDWPYSSSRHYLLGEKDPLVDSYENSGLPEGIDWTDEKVFEKGQYIGSDLFEIYTEESV